MICMICGRTPQNQEDKESFVETDDGWTCPQCMGEDTTAHGFGMHEESLYGDTEDLPEEDY